MVKTYDYMPEDIKELSVELAEDLQEFYEKLEAMEAEPKDENRWEVEKWWEIVFFSIKHRLIEDAIDEAYAENLKHYIGGLTHDKL